MDCARPSGICRPASAPTTPWASIQALLYIGDSVMRATRRFIPSSMPALEVRVVPSQMALHAGFGSCGPRPSFVCRDRAEQRKREVFRPQRECYDPGRLAGRGAVDDHLQRRLDPDRVAPEGPRHRQLHRHVVRDHQFCAITVGSRRSGRHRELLWKYDALLRRG